MNYLLSLKDWQRQTITYGLFLLTFIGFLITASMWFVFLTFVSIGFMIYTNIKAQDKHFNDTKTHIPSALSTINFEADKTYLADNFLSGLAINRSQEELVILTRNTHKEEFSTEIIPFKNIIESTIKEDNVTVTRSSKGAMVGGALIGGALAGGVGAVVGGLSGNKTATDKVYNMNLSIVIDDLNTPHYEINFMNVPQGVAKSSPVYQNISKEINNWHKTFTVIMNRNDKLNSKMS